MMVQAVQIGQETLGPDDTDLALRFNNLALLRKEQVRPTR